MKMRICCALFLSASILAQEAHTSLTSLKNLLAKQGFTGALDGKITIKRLGVLHCGSRQFESFYHTWEQSNPPGARHAAYRVVLVEEGSKYVGSYRVPESPARITRSAILFNFEDEDGNIIQCDGDNPPASVVLDGEFSTLFK
jgi:hypothetical protein